MSQQKSRITAGEWECEGDQFAVWINAVRTHEGRPDYVRVATVDRHADTENEDGSDANANLIAAAPDLLVALQTIALHASSLDATGIRELCDAAIAKAEGRS